MGYQIKENFNYHLNVVLSFGNFKISVPQVPKIAVSYTHLDVYKRQNSNNKMNMM